MDRILSVIVRMLVRKGVNFGIRAVSRRGQKQNGTDPNRARTGGQNRLNGKQGTRGVRRAMRVLRRMNRF